MIFDVRQAGRLLREDWADPKNLARELYSMIVSKEAKRVEAPVSIAVKPGETALRLSRAEPPPRSTAIAARKPDPPTQRRPPAPPPLRSTTISKLIRHFDQPVRDAAQALITQVAAPTPRPPATTPPATVPSSARPVPAVPQSSPRRPTPQATQEARPRVQIGPSVERVAFRLVPAPPEAPSYARPYEAPLFSVDGAIRVEPDRPVQFEHPPVVFNKASQEYEPWTFKQDLTKIPREEGVYFWFGKVKSKGTAGDDGFQQYKVDFYRYPGAVLEFTDTVRIWVLDPADSLPNTYPLWPIFQCPLNELFYAQPPLFY